MLTATNQRKVIHPVVIVCVEGIKCRALLDTGSSSTYVSSTLIDMAKKQPLRNEYKSVEMMLQRTSEKMEVYELQINEINEKFSIKSEVNKVDRDVLLTLPNPQYERVIQENSHLRGVVMDDKDSKDMLPVHMILGGNDYALIKTPTPTRVGEMGQPIAECT